MRNPTLVLFALSLLQAGTALADPPQGYRARFWNLTNAMAGDDPSLTIEFENNADGTSGYAQHGSLKVSKASPDRNLSFGDNSGMLQVKVSDKYGGSWDHSYPGVAFQKTHTDADGTECELQAFSDGVDYWLVEFDDPSASDKTREYCKNLIDFNLKPEEKDQVSAEDRLQTLQYGKRRLHRTINNIMPVDVQAEIVHEGGKCKLAPNKVRDALLAQLHADVDGMVKKSDPSDLSARDPKETDPGQRDSRCYANFMQTYDKLELQVILETGPEGFIDTANWPKLGDPHPQMDTPYEVSCKMKTVKVSSPLVSNYFVNLKNSLAGRPLPGIVMDTDVELGGHAQKDLVAEDNILHDTNYGKAARRVFYGDDGKFHPIDGVFTDGGGVRHVTVARDHYDSYCGNPVEQFNYAAGFIEDVNRGRDTGKAVARVSTGGMVVTGGIIAAPFVGAAVSGGGAVATATAATTETVGAAAVPTLSVGLGGTGLLSSAAALPTATGGATALIDAVVIAGGKAQHETAPPQPVIRVEIKAPVLVEKTPPPPPKKAQGAGAGHTQAPARQAPPPPKAPETPPPPPVQTPKLNKPIISSLLKGQNDKAPPVVGDLNALNKMGSMGKGKNGNGIGDMAGVLSGNSPGPKVVMGGPPTAAVCSFPQFQVDYPQAGREAKVEGKVYLLIHIGKDASITSVTVKGIDPQLQSLGFEQKSIDSVFAAAQGHCSKPGMKAGAPANSSFPVTIPFTLTK